MGKTKVALAGNPNVGKTSLFNVLTGTRQHVGNWPGVTVEKKVGETTYNSEEIEITDLPGTYSLTAYSIDEIVARDYIVDEKPDVVVQVVDATNIERNLYLTTQLMELGTKVVIALNMSDIAESQGIVTDINRMREFLEIPVVKTVAKKGQGLNELLDVVVEESKKKTLHIHEIGYGNDIEKDISELEFLLEKDENLYKHYPLRWLSIKILEGDNNVLAKIQNSQVKDEVDEYLKKIDTDYYEALMADRRYGTISSVVSQVCTGCIHKVTPSDMIDRVLTNKYLGLPIFLALMWGAFEFTFSLSAPFMDLIDKGFVWLAGFVADNIETAWLASLIGDGIIGGVGAVLVFVPNIFILFFLLSILEDSGYLARAAFIMDKVMYSIGLQGKSFIPMLMGFGCNVPAIMATRTIEDHKDRLVTIMITPFMSCSARLPVYVLLGGAFFGKEAGTVIFGLYVLGILVAVLTAKLFRSTILKGDPAPFIMELPPYRIPHLTTSLMHMWDKGYTYIKKAGSIILVGVVVVWLLASLPFGVEYGSANSLVGTIGHLLEPLVAPLGFDWKIAVSLVLGFVAKEIVIGSLGTLYGTGEGSGLMERLQADPELFALNSLGLMVFILLYMPCIATVGVVKQETGSWKWTLFSVVYGIAVAWIFAFIIYQGGLVLGF
ncbi:ferrous iron transport protein B [Methanohalobium evestigatum Z-7303]|uniref:Ferrous iron transport protein B n=1 Tax=Methanohalobium evestigatum (strain ATCC BAA-1072 / DSM 3721 / NBRC 107634 / OCM 161 / Z-7303) TaxID=644295 RepID=D7E7U5_METEZ|nr:ferrous iron transport protein B [Methanohalobium evestigatum]ADI74168.1 ferrous iron transport protein B [Methanohalobium evestigatum Z-7303]